jgi:hypothetical protein
MEDCRSIARNEPLDNDAMTTTVSPPNDPTLFSVFSSNGENQTPNATTADDLAAVTTPKSEFLRKADYRPNKGLDTATTTTTTTTPTSSNGVDSISLDSTAANANVTFQCVLSPDASALARATSTSTSMLDWTTFSVNNDNDSPTSRPNMVDREFGTKRDNDKGGNENDRWKPRQQQQQH